MRVMSTSFSHEPPFSATKHSSVVAEVENSAADVIEILIYDEVREKELAARPFDPQIYRRKKAWLALIQVVKVQSTLPPVPQKHEDELQESLKAGKVPV